MAEYISNMNRLDWAGNEGGTIRRGEWFNLDDADRAQTLLDAGYISEVPVETSDPIPEPHVETSAHPTTSWTITDIKTWLDAADIEYSDRAVKAELLTLANPVE